MTLQEILVGCASCAYDEKRYETDEYVEIVVENDTLGAWETVFVSFLGAPVSGPGDGVSKEDDKLTKQFGGVRVNQTLYKKMTMSEVVLIMLWPWSDECHTTIRMARITV